MPIEANTEKAARIASKRMRIIAQLCAFISLLITPDITHAQESDGWIRMFNGKTLNGWKANENPESWSVREGVITGDGEKRHLFWMCASAATANLKRM